MLKRFSDEQARSILARAIELDAHAPTTSVDDLRAIASDLGVAHESLDAALREHSVASRARRMKAGKRAATVVSGLGVPMGVVTGALLTSGGASGILTALGMTGIALIASGALVILPGRAATLRSFHLKNLVLWGGVAAGSLVSALFLPGSAPAMMIAAGWSLRAWLASSILGTSAVIAVRRAHRPDDTGSGPNGVERSAKSAQRLLVRAVKRALGWLNCTFRRDRAHFVPGDLNHA